MVLKLHKELVITGTNQDMLFVGKFIRSWNFGLGKKLSTISEAEWAILVENFKKVILRIIQNLGSKNL